LDYLAFFSLASYANYLSAERESSALAFPTISFRHNYLNLFSDRAEIVTNIAKAKSQMQEKHFYT